MVINPGILNEPGRPTSGKAGCSLTDFRQIAQSREFSNPGGPSVRGTNLETPQRDANIRQWQWYSRHGLPPRLKVKISCFMAKTVRFKRGTMTLKMIQVTSLAHAHYQHPNLEKASTFFIDFGLIEEARTSSKIFLRGNGAQPYIYVAEQSPDENRHFIGAYWNAASLQALQDATTLPNASQIEDNDGPGGGKVVRVVDPHGFVVGFIYGQTMRPVHKQDLHLELRTSDLQSNSATEKPRKGSTRRFQHGPSPVNKLGHYGISVPKARYKETMDWYMSVLNLKPTDAIFDPESGEELTCFTHIDLGPEYTDHHVSIRIPSYCFLPSRVQTPSL